MLSIQPDDLSVDITTTVHLGGRVSIVEWDAHTDLESCPGATIESGNYGYTVTDKISATTTQHATIFSASKEVLRCLQPTSKR